MVFNIITYKPFRNKNLLKPANTLHPQTKYDIFGVLPYKKPLT